MTWGVPNMLNFEVSDRLQDVGMVTCAVNTVSRASHLSCFRTKFNEIGNELSVLCSVKIWTFFSLSSEISCPKRSDKVLHVLINLLSHAICHLNSI